MTIYILKWINTDAEADQKINRVYATSSYADAMKKYRQVCDTENADLRDMNIDEVLTKHTPSTQKDVIELINTLNDE